jgi:hypothetical protein
VNPKKILASSGASTHETHFGIENVMDLVKIHKDDPTLHKRRNGNK